MIGVISVNTIDNYKLVLKFNNNKEKVFDMRPYLSYGIFNELKNKNLFDTVKISFDSIEWANGADLCPEVLYNESVEL